MDGTGLHRLPGVSSPSPTQLDLRRLLQALTAFEQLATTRVLLAIPTATTTSREAHASKSEGLH